MAGLELAASATVGGKRTNRVTVERLIRRAPPGPPKRYRKDASTLGLPYRVIAISVPVAELAALDASCERAQMARSHYIRQAVKFFAAHVAGVPR